VRGTPVPVLDTVVTKSTGAGSFSMSLTGTFAYTSGAQSGPPQRTLVWVDRTGREEPLGVPPRTYVQPRISPDGTRVALDIRDREPDIWIWDFTRRTLTRLTSDSGRNRNPLWSPDGRRVVFSALRDGSSNIFWRVADGSGASERLIESTNDRYLSSFSADGKWLVFDQPQISAPDRDLGVIRVESEPRRAELLLNAAFNEENGAISPDGAWLAYQSNESGLDEIYVRPFPALQAGRWQISSGGGSRPIWARNGRELFYLAGTDRLRAMAAAVQPGTVFSIGNPQLLFEGPYFEGGGAIAYDVSPDGKRLLMIKDAVATESAAQPAEIVVTLNWFEELKRLVPAN
jgi:serine/threonine-protein kinase